MSISIFSEISLTEISTAQTLLPKAVNWSLLTYSQFSGSFLTRNAHINGRKSIAWVLNKFYKIFTRFLLSDIPSQILSHYCWRIPTTIPRNVFSFLYLFSPFPPSSISLLSPVLFIMICYICSFMLDIAATDLAKTKGSVSERPFHGLLVGFHELMFFYNV